MVAVSQDFALGVEEELIAVDPATLALAHTGVDTLARMVVPEAIGFAHPDTYASLIELATPVSANAADAATSLAGLRALAREAGGTMIGAGVHPDGDMGDVVHVDEPRYAAIHAELRGLLRRTPTCATHVHVGMPDPETTIRVYNGLREHLPLLQALAANSPFQHGADSGLATARALQFGSYPRAEIAPAFGSFAEFEAMVDGLVAAGDAVDYTFLWWDVRPHPRLGTVEVRAMDAQSALWSSVALAGLIHGLARAAAEEGPPPGGWTRREVLMESSFRAARDGLAATLLHDGALRPMPEIARAAVARARPYARELGSDGALDLVERILVEGNGADRQRAAFARGGMLAVLEQLAAETAAELGA